MTFAETFRLLIYGPAMVNVMSDPIEGSDLEDLPKLRRYMVDVMRKAEGVGLAAPQIGLFKRFVIIEKTRNDVVDLVNPRIIRMYGKELEDYESCLSLPPQGNECLVPRVQTIHVEASTSARPDYRKEFVFRGSIARIVQHELDHLTGTFFVDRVSMQKKREVLEKFEDWKARRTAKIRYAQKGNENVDAGIVAARGGKSHLS